MLACTAVDGLLRSGRSVHARWRPAQWAGWTAAQCEHCLRSCQCKSWAGISTMGPWPSATCIGQASSSSSGRVNTCHGTLPCALSWCTECMSKTWVRVATHELCCCCQLDGSDMCPRCSGDRLKRHESCVIWRASGIYTDLSPQPCIKKAKKFLFSLSLEAHAANPRF